MLDVVHRIPRSGTSISHRDVAIPVLDEIEPPSLVLLLKPVLALVLDEKEGKEDTKQTTTGGNDEGVLLAEVGCTLSDRLPHERAVRRTLNRGEALGTDGCTGFANGGADAIARPSDTGRVRPRRMLGCVKCESGSTYSAEMVPSMFPGPRFPLDCMQAYRITNRGIILVILSKAHPTMRPKTI